MGISKTEINLRRLLAAAPQQQNRAKLFHYVDTLQELLEQLAEERTPDGLPRVSKAKVNYYSMKAEIIASRFAGPLPHVLVSQDPLALNSAKEILDADGETQFPSSPGLRRRFVPILNTEDRIHEITQVDTSGPVKLDTAVNAHIEKHRKFQDDLTDEMVGFAQQLKESSLLMSRSLQNTEKILNSTENAVEQSLASTDLANVQAMEIKYSDWWRLAASETVIDFEQKR